MASVGSGSLITRNYNNFIGVDFTNKETALTRSPDSINMWRDYSYIGNCIETRPVMKLENSFDYAINGHFFYEIGDRLVQLVHSGVNLYKVENGIELIASGLNNGKSKGFVFNNIFYFMDGINYKKYDGETLSDVEGYIPTTSFSRKPEGGGSQLEAVNLISPYRINTFVADGESLEYYLDTTNIDREYTPIVEINDEQQSFSSYTVDYTKGKIVFNSAPQEPDTTMQDNVKITFRKTVSGYDSRIKRCRLVETFDSKVFVSGNVDYPNALWHSADLDPTYFPDINYSAEGLDLAPIKDLVVGNNALWVFKAPSQANTTIFYHQPTTVLENGVMQNKYPSTHSSINTGCIGKAINFNDDIVFFSDRGMEGISGDITTEQVLGHRSTLVDTKMIVENNYSKMILQEFEGYLMVIIGNKVYLADSRQKTQNIDHLEYEWFYWELPKEITTATVYNRVLYLGAEDGIYKLDRNPDESIEPEMKSYWCTTCDNFGYDFWQKTTNKRGSVTDAEGIVYVQTRRNNEDFSGKVEHYARGYFVNRIKVKKFKTIQLKFSSNNYFRLYGTTLQAYIGNYVKR